MCFTLYLFYGFISLMGLVFSDSMLKVEKGKPKYRRVQMKEQIQKPTND